MDIKNLQEKARNIWGEQKLSLSQMIVRYGVVMGDICRWERNYKKDADAHTDEELKKEFGNLIFCTIRWCDELGYQPEECVNLAIECQQKLQDKM